MSSNGGAIWTPDADDVARAAITRFTAEVLAAEADAGRGDHGIVAGDYESLREWTVAHPARFWRAVWEHFGLADRRGVPLGETDADVLADASMPGAEWFPGVTLNYVDQVFRHAESPDAGTRAAIIARTESGDRVEWSWTLLRTRVRELAAFLASRGVGRGDRVAGFLPDLAETVVAFLATAHLGAVWSGCGQDYAAGAAASRLGQLEPAVLVTTDGYHHGGKWIDKREDAAELAAALPGLRALVVLERRGADGLPAPEGVERTTWDAALAAGAEALRGEGPHGAVAVPLARPEAVPFDHPLWVLFSSGTTGTPKGIVHGHGGVLLEHLKTCGLHNDMGPGDVFFWYTSLSWMMWNYQVAGLLTGATILCFDGSPVHPDPDSLWAVVADERVTVFGTSPGQILASRKAGLVPRENHDMSALRILGSTGSTLPSESFHWVADNVGEHVPVSSISGGTDVVSAFAGGTPTVEVVPGELSVRYLGVALESWDPAGKPLIGEVGEMVITAPMPSMPLYFWGDPDGARYRDAYFDTYPGVWRHGDWVTVTPRGSITIHGRSDATLNRNGIRMGSSDIYAVVEAMPQVKEAFVLGVEGPDGAYWMPMFVTLMDGVALTDELVGEMRDRIRAEASPRHVPDEVLLAPGIPHTRTGKKLEVPVKAILQGREDVNVDPQSVDDVSLLDWYREAGERRPW